MWFIKNSGFYGSKDKVGEDDFLRIVRHLPPDPKLYTYARSLAHNPRSFNEIKRELSESYGQEVADRFFSASKEIYPKLLAEKKKAYVRQSLTSLSTSKNKTNTLVNTFRESRYAPNTLKYSEQEWNDSRARSSALSINSSPEDLLKRPKNIKNLTPDTRQFLFFRPKNKS